jgi:hypothetical protein
MRNITVYEQAILTRNPPMAAKLRKWELISSSVNKSVVGL